MKEQDLDELIKLFKQIQEELFLKKCHFKEDCRGCNHDPHTCVVRADVAYWLERYRKMILKSTQ